MLIVRVESDPLQGANVVKAVEPLFHLEDVAWSDSGKEIWTASIEAARKAQVALDGLGYELDFTEVVRSGLYAFHYLNGRRRATLLLWNAHPTEDRVLWEVVYRKGPNDLWVRYNDRTYLAEHLAEAAKPNCQRTFLACEIWVRPTLIN